MPTYYKRIEDSSEVMDVLYAVVLGTKRPKEISEKLGRGSNVRSKLLFLKNNKIVIKDKWDYSVNWNVVYRQMLNATKQVIKHYIELAEGNNKKKLEEIRTNVKKYFSKPLLVGILKSYSMAFFKGYEKVSLKGMMKMFLNQITGIEDKDLEKLDKNLVKLKKALKGIPTKEEELFSGLLKL